MKVCFFRHGPAVERGTPGIPDDERPLTPDGRKRSRRAARGLRSLGLGIDRVCSSPLPRAMETARILADVLGLPEPETLGALAGGGGDVVGVLTNLDAACPVLVGHEPALSDAISRLVCGRGGGDYALKKAGLAVVEILGAGPRPRGRLLLLVPPAVLRGL